MPSMTQTAATINPPAPARPRVLDVDGTPYRLAGEPATPPLARGMTFLLDHPRGGPCVVVVDDRWGSACSCGTTRCGHLRALRAAGLLVSPEIEACPRCGGRGILALDRPEGLVREPCRSCGGCGRVDQATAREVRQLMCATPQPTEDPMPPTTAPTRNDFVAYLKHQADQFRFVDPSPFSDWVASRFDLFIELAKLVDATDPATLEDRLAALERDEEVRR